MKNTPYAGVFAEIIEKKDYRYRSWLSQAKFQLKLTSCSDLARFATGEDIIMEVIEGVLSGKIKWDTDKVPNVTTFMYHQIRSHISNLRKKETNRLRLSNNIRQQPQCFIVPEEPDDIPGEAYEKFIIQQDLLEIREIILKKLEKDIIAFFVFGEIIIGSENRQIAENLGISIREVENAKKRICTIIKSQKKK